MTPKLLDRQTELHTDGTARTDEPVEKRKMRVLVANEPRLYREVISATLSKLRPEVEVLLVDPETLDQRVKRETPDLVFCSRATPCVVDAVPAWAEVYPEEEPLLVVSISLGETRLTAIDDNGLPNLLWIVDQAKLLFERET